MTRPAPCRASHQENCRCFEVPACVARSAMKSVARQKPCTTVIAVCVARPAAHRLPQTSRCAKRTLSSRRVNFWSRPSTQVLANGDIFVPSADRRFTQRPTQGRIKFRYAVAPWTLIRSCGQRSISTPAQKRRGSRYVTDFPSSPGNRSSDAEPNSTPALEAFQLCSVWQT